MTSRTRIAALVSAPLAALLVAGCGVSTNQSGATVPPPSNATPTPTAQPTATSTDTPVPTPTPQGSTATCSFVWATDYSSVDGTIDFFEVDVAQTAWSNATNAYDGANAVGYFVSGYDPNTGDILYGAGMSTAGAITLSVGNTTMGSPAGFTDTASHTFYDATALFQGQSNALGDAIATGGTGSFSGNLSDPDPNAAVTPGTGSIDATDGTNTETFGDPSQSSVTYAFCGQ